MFDCFTLFSAEDSKPRFDFANLAKSATQKDDDDNEKKQVDTSQEKEAKIISSVIMNAGSLRYKPSSLYLFFVSHFILHWRRECHLQNFIHS